MKKKINIEKVEGFFYAASKKLIFIPLVIVFLALVFKATSASKTAPIADTLNWNSLTPTAAVESKKQDFSLKGPYVCAYTDKTGGVDLKAYVKNKNIALTITEKGKVDKYLLKGDCAYLNGQKICGITPYVSLMEGMLNNNVTGLETMWSKYSKTKVDFREALKSCVKKDFEDSVFN